MTVAPLGGPRAVARMVDDTAELLRRLLAEVEARRLDAPGPQGARLLRRMEGAVLTLEQLGRRRRRRQSSGSA